MATTDPSGGGPTVEPGAAATASGPVGALWQPPPTTGPPPRRRRTTTSEAAPDRPHSFTPGDLRFTPQRATRWFSPGVLTQSGLKVGVTSVFGSFLDKRELQSSRPPTIDRTLAHERDLWFDYVADTGDGFEATATVAHEVGRPTITVPIDGIDTELPRGRLLVFGGDEVYPAASTEGYENRLEGPWRAALPWTPPADPDDPAHPRLYAVPGNHDWYDGLTGFLRMFGQSRWIGGWRTHQSRSYFAVQLPHRWWLWGIDIQSDALIDDPQLDYFEWVAEQHTEPGDRIVLATPVPTWTQLERDPTSYRNLAYFERAFLRPNGLDLRLTLAGDLHHYARYEQGEKTEVGPAHKITAGGGGAFLHPTHDLPTSAEVAVNPDDPSDRSTYTLQRRYPSAGRSRLLSLRALTLPWRNPSFLIVPALASLTLLWTVQFGLRSLEQPGVSFADAAGGWGWADGFGGVFRNSLSLVMVLVLWGGLFGFARTPPWVASGVPRYVAKIVMSLVHLLAQLAAIAGVGVASVAIADWLASDGWTFALVAGAAAAVLGAIACSLVVGAYLAAAIGLPGLRAHANEAFAAARITGYKNFLRLHVEPDRLTIYAIGIDRAVKRRHWDAAAGGDDPSASWIEPARDPIRVHLIEKVVIEAPAPAPEAAAEAAAGTETGNTDRS